MHRDIFCVQWLGTCTLCSLGVTMHGVARDAFALDNGTYADAAIASN